MKFYKSNPEMILKNGDVRITFQPDTAEYFEIYYFRGGEFLFSRKIDLPNSHIDKYGANFEEYAGALPRWSSPSDIPKILLEYAIGNELG